MNSTIEESTLTDGSKVYAVSFIGFASKIIVIDTASLKDAEKLQEALKNNAICAYVK